MTGDCPDCREPFHVERLAHGWRFCARCGLTWLLGDCGVVHRQLTNHSKTYSPRTCADSTERRAVDG